MTKLPVVVMDNGTGYTKLGFSGNNEPSFVFPTAISTRESVANNGRAGVPSKSSFLSNNLASKRGIEDLDFYIGDEPLHKQRRWP
ncbi:unnamed protein product [Rhizopus stolonifer]